MPRATAPMPRPPWTISPRSPTIRVTWKYRRHRRARSTANAAPCSRRWQTVENPPRVLQSAVLRTSGMRYGISSTTRPQANPYEAETALPEAPVSKQQWRELLPRIEELAARAGLQYKPVDFEAVPASFMLEIAEYGLPVRMPHWSFGVRYISQLIQHRMGHYRLFEVVFPGNPAHAYLPAGHTLA